MPQERMQHALVGGGNLRNRCDKAHTSHALDQWIDLETVPRHFGGRQWFCVCPRTERRVSVLWKPPGSLSFASRQAWGRHVAYGSQFETPRGRALSAAQAIRCKLGGKDLENLVIEWMSD